MRLKDAYDIVAAKLPINDPQVHARLNRGYGILISTGYTVVQHGELYRINKASTSLFDDSSASYLVDPVKGMCSCPDWQTARSGLCKHRCAVMLVQEMLAG